MKHRIALCIGVAAYQPARFSLPNPINDAKRIHAALQSRGFDSTLLTDPTAAQITAAVEALRARVDGHAGDRVFSVVYYAGHAVEIGGFGVLMPADSVFPATPQSLAHGGVPVLEIVDALKAGHGPKVVIVDACRDAVRGWTQPQMLDFTHLSERETKRPKRAAEASDVVIAYSTSAGQKAYDGTGANSTYCQKLEAALLRHDATIVESLGHCGQEVITESKALQRPWIYTNVSGRPGFSDLPVYALAWSAALHHPTMASTRLHEREMDAAVVVNAKGHMQLVTDGVVRNFVRHPKKYTVASVREGEVLLAGRNVFVSLDAPDSKQKVVLTPDAKLKIKCADPFGICQSPDGVHAVVYGLGGYSILRREGEGWQLLFSESRSSDVYGAKFQSNDELLLCGGSSDSVGRLDLSAEIPVRTSIPFGRRQHVYDLAWVQHTKHLIAVCAAGEVIRIETQTGKVERRSMFEWPSADVPGAYGRLRHHRLSSDDANLFLADPERFDAECGETVWHETGYQGKRPSYHLLCCAMTKDPRLLAIGADQGLVFLVDVRTFEHVATLDAGSSIGVGLRWMTCSQFDGAIHALGNDGVIRCFEPIPPFV
ncbi:caspase family protein [Lysobacter sp. CA196]|uniref:caspase family protein n=1 Tax=Lysobacter sp. CA196 TaxID=3455606 RepID=UPI003F8D6207